MIYSTFELPVPPMAVNINVSSIKIKFGLKPCIIISLYLPKGPNESNTDWIKQLNRDQDNNFILTGDFNAHAPFWERNCQIVTSNRLLENIIDSKLYLLNNGDYTRIPDNPNHKPTSIDLSLISPQLAPHCDWSIWHDTLGSDHLPILLKLHKHHITPPDESDYTVPRFKYKSANWILFYTNLSSKNIDNLDIQNNNVNTLYSSFTKLIIDCAKEPIPQVKYSPRSKHKGNIWWSKECEIARKEKWKAYKIYLKNPTVSNLLESKKAKNKSNRVVKEAKKLYWENYCLANINTQTNIQEVWKKIKSMKNHREEQQYPIKVENDDIPSQFDKAEEFVAMFASNSSLSGLLPDDRDYRLNIESRQEINNNANVFNKNNQLDSDISREELLHQINKLSTKSSSVGLDGIANIMLKHLPSNLLDLLLQIFNKSWSEGSLPTIWKLAIIIPIHKTGKPLENVNSYRPIALISHVGKLLERILHVRLNYFINSKHLIPLNQAGFRLGRSTTEHLLKLTTNIKQQFARRKNVLATFFDVK